jgi:hypothetical protein
LTGPSAVRVQMGMVQPVGPWEAEVDHAGEVDPGGAVGEPEPVAVDAAVAESPVGAADEPGDAAFDHGAVLPVCVGEGLGHGEGSGGGEQAMVGVHHDDPAASCGGAAAPQWAGRAVAASRAWRRAVTPARQVTAPAVPSMSKSSRA